MKKSLRFIVLIVVAIFVLIQFFQPERNNGIKTNDHLFLQTQVPEKIKLILENACLDCHSDQTRYEWYHRISPVSWYIASHISEGKHELNFSEWQPIPNMDKIGLLEDMKKEIDEGKMPLKSYALMHTKARLNDAQKDSLFLWIESYQEELVVKALE